MAIILCCGMSEEMEMIQPGPEAAAGSELSERLRKTLPGSGCNF
ncbi:hypothetical protein [Eisenbergiella sp.]